jgi:hypothetical protein
LDFGPIGLSLSKLWKAEKIRSDGRQNLNGIDDKALTKICEDENFFRKRLEMPLLPEDEAVASEPTISTYASA